MPNPDVPLAGEIIEDDWGAAVVSRLVPIYADAAARDTDLPTPEDGQLAYTTDDDDLYLHVAGGWRPILTTPLNVPAFDLDGRVIHGFKAMSLNQVNDLDGSIGVTSAAADPNIGNATVLTVIHSVARAFQLAVEKNGGAFWFRGVVSNGPGWAPWSTAISPTMLSALNGSQHPDGATDDTLEARVAALEARVTALEQTQS